MDQLRRVVLKAAGAFAVGVMVPVRAIAASWNKDAFAAKSAADALKALGSTSAETSGGIVIEAPQIAENGAVVPVEITSKIAGTTSIAVLVDKNPYPLVARFDFMEGALPHLKVNLKMGETSDVRVVATAGGKHYVATREIKVTIGGCGG